MHELKLIRAVEKMPVFSLADAAKITGSRNYAKKLLARLVKQHSINKIMRDVYSVHEDTFLIAPFIYAPSYISCASALQYYGLITQIPNAVFLRTPKRSKIIKHNETPIIYSRTKDYSGFEVKEYSGMKVPIAEPEKAFIDSIGIHPLHITIGAIYELNPEKILLYAKRNGQIKRASYLLEKYNRLKKMPKNISIKYIYLDPLGPKKGKKDKKWKLIINF